MKIEIRNKWIIMPLIVLTGFPSSGKTTRAIELRDYFEKNDKQVHIISEQDQMVKADFDKKSLFSDSSQEKHIRGLLKSEVLRLITPQNVVILDGLNYIKGYRYELYCGSKANKSTQCTIHTQINVNDAWSFNENRSELSEKHNRDTFDALIMRYEEPDGKNRWDSPLFICSPQQDLDMEAINSSLFHKVAPPPNMSTQNPPLSSTNFLYDLDQVTKKIVESLGRSISMGCRGMAKIEGFPDVDEVDVSNATVQKLLILRRQYLTYSKMHAPDPKQIPVLFVQYLNSSL